MPYKCGKCSVYAKLTRAGACPPSPEPEPEPSSSPGVGESVPLPHYIQNLAEAEYVVATYMYMRLQGIPASKISIITTYNGQKDLLTDVAMQRCGESAHLTPTLTPTLTQTQTQTQTLSLSLTLALALTLTLTLTPTLTLTLALTLTLTLTPTLAPAPAPTLALTRWARRDCSFAPRRPSRAAPFRWRYRRVL